LGDPWLKAPVDMAAGPSKNRDRNEVRTLTIGGQRGPSADADPHPKRTKFDTRMLGAGAVGVAAAFATAAAAAPAAQALTEKVYCSYQIVTFPNYCSYPALHYLSLNSASIVSKAYPCVFDKWSTGSQRTCAHSRGYVANVMGTVHKKNAECYPSTVTGHSTNFKSCDAWYSH